MPVVHHKNVGDTRTTPSSAWRSSRRIGGRALGRKLTEMAIQHGRDAGLLKLYLRVFDHNARGIKLYVSLGFVEEARLEHDVLRGDGTLWRYDRDGTLLLEVDEQSARAMAKRSAAMLLRDPKTRIPPNTIVEQAKPLRYAVRRTVVAQTGDLP